MPKHVAIYVNLEYNEHARSGGVPVSDILCPTAVRIKL